jgi:haloalkane dehalogenase
MRLLRTPDDCFAHLPAYPFAPHYQEVDGVRLHYVDEGPAQAPTVLLLHGEPSWSYLYRKMIPPLTAAGLRTVAPDLVGFGRSDKPADRSDYTYQRHIDWVWGFIQALDLRDITLVCQDWGGLLGLRIAGEHGDRFARIVAANTALPTGDMPMGRAFQVWQQLSQRGETLDVGRIIQNGCRTPLADDVVAAYDAPFPDESYKAGARQFPLLVPTAPDDPATPANRAAWQALGQWDKPFLTAFSDGDPITQGADLLMQRHIPGTKGQPHTTIVGGGHFLQEDRGAELAQVIIAWLQSGTH